jgi:hypothetical protein
MCLRGRSHIIGWEKNRVEIESGDRSLPLCQFSPLTRRFEERICQLKWQIWQESGLFNPKKPRTGVHQHREDGRHEPDSAARW